MTAPNKSRTKKIAAIVGVVLALVCQALPADYQKPCQTIAHLCTGGAL